VSTARTETLAERYFAAWEARDPARIVELHAPDTRFQIHAGGEVVEGREAVREAFAGIFRRWPDFRFETYRVLYGDDHWVLDWALISTLKRDERGGRAERAIRFDCLDVVTVRDGLVVRKDTYVDGAQFAAATGGT
jgi:uncharacterized protein (TIGR02246 family)